ncbi:hypothetical protein [Actinokineospora cianjurensis]|uniref:Uncharacterized protein n=1 Tax=Actinokineospora cianjurensis TaxID=585224 RepID=A0A421AYS1_9PSEU|nr:hypothetical protein [Actinokineospora cianjurensis]RLK55007.1 hypothetical protein CLV68_5399 [Actinokineospora cianjurensis]
MTRVPSTPRPHPHGLIGYVVDDPARTDQALRLLRWIIPAAIAALIILGAIVLVLAPNPATAAITTAAITATGGGLVVARRRVRR